MHRNISPEALKIYQERYKKGTRVVLTAFRDPYEKKLKVGDTGTVDFVDALGTIHVDWDCGSHLGVAFGEDACRVIE
jgi:hypothetical protein